MHLFRKPIQNSVYKPCYVPQIYFDIGPKKLLNSPSWRSVTKTAQVEDTLNNTINTINSPQSKTLQLIHFKTKHKKLKKIRQVIYVQRNIKTRSPNNSWIALFERACCSSLLTKQIGSTLLRPIPLRSVLLWLNFASGICVHLFQ